MFIPRMLVMYEGLQKLSKEKIVANCQVIHKAQVPGGPFYNRITSDFNPFIDIRGQGFNLSLYNPQFFIDYSGIKITGTIPQHYEPSMGWISIHQEVLLIPSMMVWDAQGGKDRDKKAGIKRDKKTS